MLSAASYTGNTIQFANDLAQYIQLRDQLINGHSPAAQLLALLAVHTALCNVLRLSMDTNTNLGTQWRDNNLANLNQDMDTILRIALSLNIHANPYATQTNHIINSLQTNIAVYRRQLNDQSCWRNCCVVL